MNQYPKISVSIPDERLIAAAKARAAAQGRSLSNYIARLVKLDAVESGELKEEPMAASAAAQPKPVPVSYRAQKAAAIARKKKQ